MPWDRGKNPSEQMHLIGIPPSEPRTTRDIAMIDRLLFFTCGVLFFVVGCGGETPSTPQPGNIAVAVAHPVAIDVQGYEEFTGRTEATELVDVRSRVSGFLSKILFDAGKPVTAEKPLFEIDHETFVAEVDRAQADIAKADAQLQRADADLERAKKLRPTRAISQEDFDKLAADRAIAAAALKSANAIAKTANANLKYTYINAPISGQIGRPLVTEGNLVSANTTVLTMIVSKGDMHVYFDVDELTLLKYKKLAPDEPENAMKDPRAKIAVLMALADEEGFPHRGHIDFIDNQLNRNTGTIQIRAKFDDPQNKLVAGAFVRVRIPIGEPKPGLLISERAVMSDQGQKYVWVVDKDGKISYQKIKLGSWQDGLRVVEDGLTSNDQVVVTGIQQVREGQKVQTQEVSMPASGLDPAAVTNAAPESSPKK
jgi:RND family efflux transporter MFP subunit